LPFEGQWLVGNTPANQIPSHGTTLFGTSYAFDFMAVDRKTRTAPSKSWRTFFGVEQPELFYSFGKSVFSPIEGEIVSIHNGEEDHVARRSWFTLLPYVLSQSSRIRKGHQAIAGNYLVIKAKEVDLFVAIVHLQKDSILVKEGQSVTEGQHIANCGNSGNSTEPHIHIQAMNTLDFSNGSGIPLFFRHFTQREKEQIKKRTNAFPNSGSVVSSEKIPAE
jgi:hypothetical protein